MVVDPWCAKVSRHRRPARGCVVSEETANDVAGVEYVADGPTVESVDGQTRLLRLLAPRLELLRALGLRQGLTVAAQQAGVPQPTASRWLAAIAAELGTDPVARVGRNLELTRAGVLLADAAESAMTDMAGGLRAAAEEADPQRGSVVFGFLHTMGSGQVPDLLRGFAESSPRVRFTLVQTYHEDLLDRVRAGGVDLALTAPAPTSDRELRSEPLYTQPIRVVLPEGHRLTNRRTVRLEDLVDERFVGMKPGYGIRRITDALFADAGFTPRFAFEGEEVDTVRGLVAAGLGIALLPSESVGPSNGTAEIDLVPALNRTVGLVWSSRRSLQPSAAVFRDHVAAECR